MQGSRNEFQLGQECTGKGGNFSKNYQVFILKIGVEESVCAVKTERTQ
jgi:hypothetical protein